MSNNRPKLDSQAYITIAYLCTVAVGMMFDYKYYQNFEINIFEYADILDFLLTPVKNLEVIAFVLASGAAVYVFFRFDSYWQKKWPKSYKIFNLGITAEASRKYRPYLVVLLSVAYLSIASDFYSDRNFGKFEESGKTIEVVYESNQRMLKGKLIGKNSDYVFLQTESQVIKAIPVASDIQEIIISRPEAEPKPTPPPEPDQN